MMASSGQTWVTIPTCTEVAGALRPGAVEDGVADRRHGRRRQRTAVGGRPAPDVAREGVARDGDARLLPGPGGEQRAPLLAGAVRVAVGRPACRGRGRSATPRPRRWWRRRGPSARGWRSRSCTARPADRAASSPVPWLFPMMAEIWVAVGFSGRPPKAWASPKGSTTPFSVAIR